ncbi:hypothetical protein [Haloferula sp.]
MRISSAGLADKKGARVAVEIVTGGAHNWHKNPTGPTSPTTEEIVEQTL